jgi:hypothetical protein
VDEARAVVAGAVGPGDGLRDTPEMIEARGFLRK